jgi:hypothetical protein
MFMNATSLRMHLLLDTSKAGASFHSVADRAVGHSFGVMPLT